MSDVRTLAAATEAANGCILEVVRVSKRYRRTGVWALRDVDLCIPAGTICALVGPNGAGKTTLIRSFIGFERPTRGSVRVMGVDPQEDGPGAVERVGFVSQSTGLYRNLRVSDHLDLAVSLRSSFDRTSAATHLDELAIPLHQSAGDLSGGQQAQVALAIALGTRAPVLLLDEPLASLDPLARRDFLRILVRDVRSRGATALLSSHIVSDVESACDAIVVLGAGRVGLHASIDAAISGHRLTRAGHAAPGEAVGRFAGADGGDLTLVRTDDPDLPAPTLDELVMGYLAASRQGPSVAEAT